MIPDKAKEEVLKTSDTPQKNESHSSMTIGQYLKEQREAKQFSLKKISHRTKISITLLENLEEDKLDNLPSKAYVSGFVKSYAQVLGISQEESLDILEKMYDSMGPMAQSKKITAFDSEDRPLSMDTTKLIGSAVGVIVILIGVAFGVKAVKDRNAQKALEASHPITPQTITPKTPLKMDMTVEVKEQTQEKPVKEAVKNEKTITQEKSQELKKKDADEKAAKAKAEKEKSKEEEKLKLAEAKKEKSKNEQEKKEQEEEEDFRDITGPLFSVADKKAAEKYKDLLPENIKAALVPGMQNLFINAAFGDTWITYKTDDAPIKKFILSKERTLLLRGKVIRIFLGNIGAAKLFLNNKLLDLQSSSGVKSLVFPAESSTKYKMPLFVFKKETGEVFTSDEYLSR